MISLKLLQLAAEHPLKSVDVKCHKKLEGKVRDIYPFDDKRILITTDRISAFDRVLGFIPYKGQVLNQLSSFWFEKTKNIVANHIINIPHPNIAVVKDATPLPVEMVVRGYISGVTKTALWKAYEEGKREIYGIKFPDGLKKNQKLKMPVITPTTKAEYGGHDEKLTEAEIMKRKLVSPSLWKQMVKVSLALYKKGNQICQKRGLILVDTKYEFGTINDRLVLIDEIHTPDSSRYWVKKSYLKRFKKDLEPENFDKEFFRIWYVKRGYRGDGPPPVMDKKLQLETAKRYIKIYEMITGKKFKPGKYPLEEKIKEVILKILKKGDEYVKH